MTTWGEVRANDVVRGADQRPWTIVGVRPGAAWIASGKTDVAVALRHDDRIVVAHRTTDQPVDLISRGDRAELAAACGALIGAGFDLTLLEDIVEQH